MTYEPISTYIRNRVKNLVFRKKEHRELIQELTTLEEYAKYSYSGQGTWPQDTLAQLKEKHPGIYEIILEEVNPEQYKKERVQAKNKLGILLPPLSELVRRLATRQPTSYQKVAERNRADYLENLEKYWAEQGGLV